jgi:hypothetical protein
MAKLLAHDPLDETDAILGEHYYGKPRDPEPEPSTSPSKEKPTHYKIVCISLYTEDIERLDAMVKELKKRGHTKANKSALIRFALDNVDLAKMPKKSY